MPFHSKINIWICLGLALLGCVYPSYLQAGGVRARELKAVRKSVNALEEFFLGHKKSDGGLGRQSARAPKALRTQDSLNRTIESALPMPYAEKRSILLERYTHDVEFQRRADQMRDELIVQGIDKAVLTFLPKHSMLDEHSSVRFVANQSDKDIDESVFYSRLGDDMKKIAKLVLDNAVCNVPPFGFLTELDCTKALKDAVKKACDELNGVEEPLPWTLKFELESDDLVFQSRDDKLPGAKLSIKTTLSELANLTNYEFIQTAPSGDEKDHLIP
jgi:hypothetical protein